MDSKLKLQAAVNCASARVIVAAKVVNNSICNGPTTAIVNSIAIDNWKQALDEYNGLLELAKEMVAA